MRIHLCVLILFGFVMWSVIFMRLQIGLVDVKVNEPKVARHVMRGVRRPCVVSMYVGDMFGDMREALIQNKRDYCKAMNYTCKIYENVLKKESRPVAWQKLYALEDSMSACSRLMWVDGDAMFMGHKPMPNPAKEIMIASEKDGVNTGVMVMHSTSWVRGLLRRVSGMHSFDTHGQWEQAALNALLQRDEEVSSRVERVDQRDLNSFDMRDAPFIYHTSGLKNKQELWRKALDSDDYTVKIVTLNTSPNKWCACGIQTIEKYAKKNGYSFEMVTTNVDSVSHPKFQKYYEVLEHFDSDLILLLDCDIAITNHSIRVEDVYNQYKTDMIIARDAQWKRGNVPINSGVIIFRKSDWTTSLLTKMQNAVRSQSEKYLGRWLVDQPVLTHILVNMGELKDRGVTEFEKSAHVSVVSQRVMNSFFRRGISFFKTDPEESIWKHGDWMAHVTGSRGDERLKIMQELGACENNCERICPCCGACIDDLNSFGLISRKAQCKTCGVVERQRMVCAIMEHKIKPTGKWLYFGPHEGHIQTMRKKYPDVQFDGIDYFANGYEQYYSKDTIRGDVQDLYNIDSNSYDGVIILHVLEHVLLIDNAISELRRILKNEGTLIQETPCQNDSPSYQCKDIKAKSGTVCQQKNHVWAHNCAQLEQQISKYFSCEKATFSQNLVRKYGLTYKIQEMIMDPLICIKKRSNEQCDVRKMTKPETMQMGQKQVDLILSKLPTNGNLLVWGLGNDSPFWNQTTCGHVVFVEDNAEWIQKIAQKYPYLHVEKVRYFTNRDQSYDKYISSVDLDELFMDIPFLTQIKWDVIIVDAPAGNYAAAPGRYQSIYTSYMLANKNTSVFVDDFERKVEHDFAIKVFGDEPISIVSRKNRKYSVKNKQAFFQIKNTRTKTTPPPSSVAP